MFYHTIASHKSVIAGPIHTSLKWGCHIVAWDAVSCHSSCVGCINFVSSVINYLCTVSIIFSRYDKPLKLTVPSCATVQLAIEKYSSALHISMMQVILNRSPTLIQNDRKNQLFVTKWEADERQGQRETARDRRRNRDTRQGQRMYEFEKRCNWGETRNVSDPEWEETKAHRNEEEGKMV